MIELNKLLDTFSLPYRSMKKLEGTVAQPNEKITITNTCELLIRIDFPLPTDN